MNMRLCTLLILGCLAASAQGSWQAGIAQIFGTKSPGTGFVVDVRDGRAYLVTAAHVVEGAQNPGVTFWIDSANKHTAEVQALEGGEQRGLALLIVPKPPAGVVALEPSGDSGLERGTSVIVAGYPLSIGAFTELPTTVAAIKGRDFFLSPKTEEGFSGGPVIANGKAAGLVWGHVNYGTAMSAQSVREYVRGLGVNWGAAPASATKPQAPSKSVVVKLVSITVLKDGSVGDTRWRFAMSTPRGELFNLPTYRYEDAPTGREYKSPQIPVREATIDLGSAEKVTLRVDAMRDDGPTGHGEAAVTPAGGELTIPLKTSGSGVSQAEFRFTFAVTPAAGQ